MYPLPLHWIHWDEELILPLEQEQLRVVFFLPEPLHCQHWEMEERLPEPLQSEQFRLMTPDLLQVL